MSTYSAKTRTVVVHAPYHWVDRTDRGEHASTSSSLSRRTIVRSALLGIGLVTYGALMPFGTDATGRLGSIEALYQRVTWHPVTGVDLCANLLVYIPVGLALRLLLRRRPVRPAREIFLATLVALALSATLESLQPHRVGRAGDVNDILANSVGALLGALLAPGVQARIRWLHCAWLRAMRRNTAATVAIGATALLAASQAMVVFRDVTLQVTRSTTGTVTHGPAGAIATWPAFEAAVMICAFALVGFFSGHAIRHGFTRSANRGARTRRWASVPCTALAATLIASLPALSPSRMLAVETLGLGVAGTAIGLCAAWRFNRRVPGQAPGRWAFRVMATAFVVFGMVPFHRAGVAESGVGFAWLPLHSAFPRAWLEWLADASLGTVWLMAGILLLAVRCEPGTHSHGRHHFGVWVLAVYVLAQTTVRGWTGQWTDSITLVIVLVAAGIACAVTLNERQRPLPLNHA